MKLPALCLVATFAGGVALGLLSALVNWGGSCVYLPLAAGDQEN